MTTAIASTSIASKSRILALGFCAALFTIALVRLAGMVAANAVDVPCEDQWDALRFLFEDQGPLAGFRQQHGPPRLGLSAVVDWYLYRATGWDVRAESWACVAALGLSALLAMHLSARLRGRPSWRDAAFALLILSPVTWEALILTPFLAHSILPLLLVVLLAQAWTTTAPAIRLPAVGLLGGIALFSGFGFCAAFASVGLAMLLWIKPGGTVANRHQLLIPIGLFLVFAAWFAWGYRWDPAVPGWHFPVANWWDYPRFMALMFTNLLGLRSLGLLPTAAGGVVLAAVLGVWGLSTIRIVRGIATRRDNTIWLLASTSLAYAAFTAVGRLPVNIEAAFMWRYTPLTMPAICALLLASEELHARSGLHHYALVGTGLMFALTATIWANFAPERNAAAISRCKRTWVATYLATGDLQTANEASHYWVYWPNPTAPHIAVKMDWLRAHQLSLFRPESTNAPAP